MAGYVDGATPFERPFQDLIESLPATLEALSKRTEYRAFGTGVSGPLPDGRARLQRAGFYSCQGAGCDNQESRLDVVLDEVARRPGDFALILTDLWFTNSDIRSSGVTALQPRLAGLLAQGRTISIYGIDAPFRGRVYDLPATESVAYEGRHPLYMIVIGTKAEAVAFDAGLARSGSRFIAEALTNGKMKKAVFTLDPSVDGASAPVFAPVGGRLLSDRFEPQTGVDIPSFRLLRRPATKTAPQATWSGPAPGRLIDGAVWRAPLSAHTRIWRRVQKSSCADKAWIELTDSGDGWSETGGGHRSLSLESPAILSRLASPGVYLVSGRLERASAAARPKATDFGPDSDADANPDAGSAMASDAADAWMRSGWNLRPEEAARVAASSPEMFPTLNLSEFARIMGNALTVAAEEKGGAIDGFSVLIQVEN